jgi:hypothetical protein
MTSARGLGLPGERARRDLCARLCPWGPASLPARGRCDPRLPAPGGACGQRPCASKPGGARPGISYAWRRVGPDAPSWASNSFRLLGLQGHRSTRVARRDGHTDGLWHAAALSRYGPGTRSGPPPSPRGLRAEWRVSLATTLQCSLVARIEPHIARIIAGVGLRSSRWRGRSGCRRGRADRPYRPSPRPDEEIPGSPFFAPAP